MFGETERKIIDAFIEHNNNPLYKTEIARRIKLQPNSISNAMKKLLGNNIIIESSIERKDKADRSARCYQLSPDIDLIAFKEIARPYFFDKSMDDRLTFLETSLVQNVLLNEDNMNQIFQPTGVPFAADEKRKFMNLIIQHPSAFKWMLFGDMSTLRSFTDPELLDDGADPEELLRSAFAVLFCHQVISDVLNHSHLEPIHLEGIIITAGFSMKYHTEEKTKLEPAEIKIGGLIKYTPVKED